MNMHDLLVAEPLNITMIMEYAEQTAASVEIVSLLNNGELHRYTYAQAFSRVRQLANVLDALLIPTRVSVAMLAGNDYRHFELQYAVPCSGRVCHSISPQLSAEQIVYSLQHADDRILFLERQFIPLLERIYPQIPHVQQYVVLCEENELPPSSLPGLVSYERLLAHQSSRYCWPKLDERSPSNLFYISRNSQLKAVRHSHRSIVLQCMAANLTASCGLGGNEVVLPMVPLYQSSSWGVVYGAVLVSAKIVLPGAKTEDGASLYRLLRDEKVSYALGLPEQWLALLNEFERQQLPILHLRRAVAGGAPCPQDLAQRLANHGVELATAWGMAEASALLCYHTPHPEVSSAGAPAGRAAFGVQLRIVDEHGQDLPWDGQASGTLHVRGPWLASDSQPRAAHDTWIDSTEIASIDAQGYVRLRERSQELIKCGDEWINPLAIEGAILEHPQVQQAAVIGLPHRRWQQRPLLIVVPKPGTTPDRRQLLQFLEGRVAKWWIPDACVLQDSLPLSANGVVSKAQLQHQYLGRHWPELIV